MRAHLASICLLSLLATTACAADAIDRVRGLRLQTPLVQDGAARAVIVAPSDPESSALAGLIAAKVRTLTRVDLPVAEYSGGQALLLQGLNVVVLGNMMNNEAIARLYRERYCFCDRVYPGEGKFVIRTVHNPYADGRNFVLVGASTPEGLKAGVNAFVGMIDGPVLDRLNVLSWAERPSGVNLPSMEHRVAALNRNMDMGANNWRILSHVAPAGRNYYLYGALDELAYFRAGFLAIAERYEQQTPWCQEWMWWPVQMWDLLEEDPAFSDADRLTITNMLLKVGRVDRKRWERSLKDTPRICGGHQLDQGLCIYYLGDYFAKYYDLPEAKEWRERGAEMYRKQSQALRVDHDSNDYEFLVIDRFIMHWALKSGDLTYFENGKARQASDLAIMCVDNLGYRPGFGDSWAALGAPPKTLLTLAAWYFNDGRYKWLIRDEGVGPGDFANDVEPVLPKDMLGVVMFPLSEEHWENYTRLKLDAPAELPAQVVPQADAFDKITFREAFDPAAQYLMLDGSARGGHGQKDGNAFIRLTDQGRIWLVDDDYIAAMPKDHNAVTIVRNGSNAVQPPLAGVAAFANLPSMGMSDTFVPSYCGVDWHRHVLWQKGRYFLVFDQLTAREAGEYRFKCLWRSLGDGKLKGQDFLSTQLGKAENVADLEADANSDGRPDGFTAYNRPISGVDVRLVPDVKHSGKTSARLSWQGKGRTAFFCDIPVEGGHRYRFDAWAKCDFKGPGQVNLYIQWYNRSGVRNGPSGNVIAGQTDWTELHTTDKADPDVKHARLVSVVYPKGEGENLAWIDDYKLTKIADDGTETVVYPSPADPEAKTTRFHIKNADAAACGMERRLIPGHHGINGAFQSYPFADGKINLLRQMAKRTLGTGDSYTFANLLYCADEKKRMDLSVKQIADGVVVVADGQAPALAGLARPRFERDGFSCEAAQFHVAARGIALLEALELSVGQVVLRSDKPVSLEFALRSRKATVRAKQPTSLTLLGKQLELDAGEHQVALTAGQALPLQARLRSCLKAFAAMPAATEASGLPSLPEASITVLHDIELPAAATALAVTDKGDLRIVVGCDDGHVVGLSSDCRTLWKKNLGGKVMCVAAGHLTRGGPVRVAVGTRDEKITLLAADGTSVWTHNVKPYHSGRGRPVNVYFTDLDGDGKKEILYGSENWSWAVLDPTGKERWLARHSHFATQACAADIDGDGKQEVLAGNTYYGWSLLSSDGKPRARFGGGPGFGPAAAADLDGDRVAEGFMGCQDGTVACIGRDLKEQWRYNVGDAVTAFAPVNTEAATRLAAGSLSCYVHLIDGQGKRVWCADVGDQVTAIVQPSADRIAVGTEAGQVVVLSTDGSPVGVLDCRGVPWCVATLGPDRDGHRRLVAATDQGRVLIAAVAE